LRSRRGQSALWFAGVLAPLVVMGVAIVASTQVLTPSTLAHPPATQTLNLLGAGTGSSEFGNPMTVMNDGNQNITILDIAYDGHIMKQGTLGGTVPQFAPPGQNTSKCYVPSDVVIFPKPASWNMDTGGLCTPTIMPGQLATIYLGEYSPIVESHTVVIHTGIGDFVYTLYPANATQTSTTYAGAG